MITFEIFKKPEGNQNHPLIIRTTIPRSLGGNGWDVDRYLPQEDYSLFAGLAMRAGEKKAIPRALAGERVSWRTAV